MRGKSTYAVVAAAGIFISVPAAAASYLSVEEAQNILFPEATFFKREKIIFSQEQKEEIKTRTGVKVTNLAQPIWRAFKTENTKEVLLGYFIFDAVIGKHDLIDYAVGLSPEGAVKGVEILTYRESYGSEVRNKNWRKQFRGKNLSSSLKLNEDIQNIGGATLSCRSVTEGIKKILGVYEVFLKGK